MNSLTTFRRRNGFTLVETVLALGVAAVSMSAIFGLLPVGLNSNQSSTEQTSATNFLTVLAADLRSTPTPTNTEVETQSSKLFEVTLPCSANNSSEPVHQILHISDDLQPTDDIATARYQINLWVTAPATERSPTTVRVLVTWPATASYQKAIGSIETMIALDRN